jgi:hypothetical protein
LQFVGVVISRLPVVLVVVDLTVESVLAGGNVEDLEFIGNFAISKQNEIPSTLAKIRGIAIR